jgi:hypothetical protein
MLRELHRAWGKEMSLAALEEDMLAFAVRDAPPAPSVTTNNRSGEAGAGSSGGGGGSSEAREEEEEPKCCIVCFDAPLEAVLVPCGHFALCMDCARRIKTSNAADCPVCRNPILSFVKLFSA